MSSLGSLGISLAGEVQTADSVTIYAPAYRTPWLKTKVHGIISIQTSDGFWLSLPDPSALKPSIYDVDSDEGTGRNQLGDMLRDRVNVKQKLTCTFPTMWRCDYQIMVALAKDTSFNVRFYSDYERGFVTKKMYTGNREPDLFNGLYDPMHPERARVSAFQMNFIEF